MHLVLCLGDISLLVTNLDQLFQIAYKNDSLWQILQLKDKSL